MLGKPTTCARGSEDVYHRNEECSGKNGEHISLDIVHKSSERRSAMRKECKGEKEHRRTNGNRRNEIAVNRGEFVKQASLTVTP